MADSTEQVAVESAASASSSAMLAVEAANAAENAVEEVRDVAQDAVIGATVTLAEQAVQIAHNESTIAQQQAAQVASAAAEAIAQNEVTEQWQDEAIRALRETVTQQAESLAAMGTQMAELRTLITAISGSPPSTPANLEATPETVTATQAEVSSTTQTEALPKSEVENPVKQTGRAKRRVRFL